MKLLNYLLFALSALPICVRASEHSEREANCDRLRDEFGKRGFLRRKERTDYCLNGCVFLRVTCVDESNSELSFDYSHAFSLIEGGFNRFLVGDELDSSLFEPDEATVEVWLSLVWRLSSLVLSIVPVLLNQYKYYNIWYASVAIVCIMLSYLFGWAPMAISIHNVVIAYLALIANSNSSQLPETVSSIIFVLLPLFSIFIIGYVWHVIVVVTVFVGFVSYIALCFFSKRRSDVSVVVMIIQLFVLAEQLQYVREMFADNSLGGTAIEIMLGVVIPGGTSRMFIVNSARSSVSLVGKLYSGPAFPAVLGTMISQLLMFTFVRASLGAYYLHVLRFRTDFESLISGFYVYVCDLFGPTRCFYRMLFKIEKFSPRRLTYALVGFFLAYYEFRHAFGFFFIRILVSCFDVLILKSKYGQMTHYLEFKIDCGQVAFPHYDAAPWFSIKALSEIADYTGVLTARIKSVGHSGMGCALVSGGRSMLYSVAHVTNYAETAQFKDRTYASPDFRKVTDGDDPITAMKADFDDAPKVELLRLDEVKFVSQLFFVNTDADSDSYGCVVPKWEVSGGKLRASVNLKRGDSGGPCFALIRDGEFRLCGVVSQGNARSGGGNIISFCYHSDTLDNNSSDDESLASVKAFNRVRRVKFASDDPEKIRLECAYSLNDFLRRKSDVFSEMRDWVMKLDATTIEQDEEELAYAMVLAEAEAEKRGGYGRKGKDKDDDDEETNKKKDKKKDAKRRRKDKAARKRAIGESRVLWEKLKQIYSRRDAVSIFDVIMMGNVPEISDREFVQRPHDGGGWIFGDSLPAVEWT